MSVQHPAHYKIAFLAIIRQLLGENQTPAAKAQVAASRRANIGATSAAGPPPILDWWWPHSLCATTGCHGTPAKRICSGKTLAPHFQDWTRARVLQADVRAGLAEYDEIQGLDGSGNRSMRRWRKRHWAGKRRPNPTDRAKRGWSAACWLKASVPLAIEVGPATATKWKLLAATLDGIVVERPEPTSQRNSTYVWKRLCGEPSQKEAQARGYEVHVPDKANAKKKRQRKGGRAKPSLGSGSGTLVLNRFGDCWWGGRRRNRTTCQCCTLLRHYLLEKVWGLEIGSKHYSIHF